MTTKHLTVVTMSGKQYPIELQESSGVRDLERQVNKLTGIRFVEQALENVYDDDEITQIENKYKENGPSFIHTTQKKFVESIDDINDGDVLRVVLSKN